MIAKSDSTRYRFAVFARVTAAIPLNYLLTAIVTALLARHLPIGRHEASVAALLTSFAIFAGIAMAIFYARSTVRMWLWMSGLTIAFGALLALSLQIGGRA